MNEYLGLSKRKDINNSSASLVETFNPLRFTVLDPLRIALLNLSITVFSVSRDIDNEYDELYGSFESIAAIDMLTAKISIIATATMDNILIDFFIFFTFIPNTVRYIQLR